MKKIIDEMISHFQLNLYVCVYDVSGRVYGTRIGALVRIPDIFEYAKNNEMNVQNTKALEKSLL